MPSTRDFARRGLTLGGLIAVALLLLPAPVYAAVAAFQEHAAAFESTTDPVSQAIVAVVVVGLFVLLTLDAVHRVLVVMASASLLWLVTYFTPYRLISFEDAAAAVDMNVILLLAGMMAVVGVLKSTGAFEWAVGGLLERAKGSPRLATRLVSWFTAGVSALLDNVTTVIFVTPMSMGVAKRLKFAPVAILLPMVVASNIGGTATLIGDPPNIMIGSGANISFIDFVTTLTAPVIVMVVALQAYLAWYYRDEYAAGGGVDEGEKHVELKDPVLLRWMMVICAGILVGFLTHSITETPAAVPAVVGAAAALVVQDFLYMRTHKPTEHERSHGILEVIEKDIEWPTLCFFVFLFIVVGAAVQTGLIGSIANGMAWAIGAVSDTFGLGQQGTLLFAALLICWVSAVLSAFIDNIPYVAVSIPIIHQLIPTLGGETMVLWWALSLGACLGGNATVVGASANVTTVGLAEKGGVRIGFAEYSRFAAPMATMTVVLSSIFLTMYIYLGSTRAQVVSWAAALVLLGIEFQGGRRLASAPARAPASLERA